MFNALILFTALALAEEPTPATESAVEETTVETTVEEKVEETKAEEVAPIPSEMVNEIEGPEKAVEEEKVEETKGEEKPVVVADPKVAEDYNQAVDQITVLVKAIQSKNWPVVAGIILMLLVFVANKFGLKNKVGAKAIPWVSLLIGIFATTGMALASGIAVTEALIQGLSAGLAAVGSWETLFKHILGGGSAPVVAEESAE